MASGWPCRGVAMPRPPAPGRASAIGSAATAWNCSPDPSISSPENRLSAPDRLQASIPFIDLKAQYAALRDDIGARMQKVLDHGQYIMGPEVAELEAALARH